MLGQAVKWIRNPAYDRPSARDIPIHVAGMKITEQGLANAAVAAERAIRAVANGEQVLADPATREKRMSTCQACEYRSGPQCTVCECLVRLKSMMLTETCPKDLWPK